MSKTKRHVYTESIDARKKRVEFKQRKQEERVVLY